MSEAETPVLNLSAVKTPAYVPNSSTVFGKRVNDFPQESPLESFDI